ncbi:hypothetical protein O163_11435 [Caldanaerobacter subterraneus subsp. yonseiensis KB-1]|uniref:Uncharacterized protein n=1 Tax=Caldanaerobacter subterraneus subsp. yonseiensis KB-1 TaxID=1388761 RepID=U5CSZ6_CALSX|nr:hypothetical protein O163_11435 [Caldanaerobacter subterraneus subsp. yonseiensis KB-1]
MSYKNFPIERMRKDRKFLIRDLRKDEIDKWVTESNRN